jgi:hypothetical protein
MLFVPLLFSVLGSLNDPGDRSSVSAFINLFFQLGGSISAATLVTVLDRREDQHLDTLSSFVTLSRVPVRMAIDAAGNRPEALGGLAQLVSQQSAAFAFADVFLLIAAATLVVIPLTLFLPRASNNDVTIEMA